MTLSLTEQAPPSEDAIAAAVQVAVDGYRRVFGGRLAQVWLFGSRARGDHVPHSDVDLLVVLHEERGLLAEWKLLSSVSNPIRLDSGVVIDGYTTTLRSLEADEDEFHYFVREEGYRIDA